MAGLSFADEKEAGRFHKKVMKEMKEHGLNRASPQHGHFGGHFHLPQMSSLTGKSNSLTPFQAPPQPEPGPQPLVMGPSTNAGTSNGLSMDPNDPGFQKLLEELKELGLSEDDIRNNQDFIISYIMEKEKEEQRQRDRFAELSNGGSSHSSPKAGNGSPATRAPPPPPPSPTASCASIGTTSTPTSTTSTPTSTAVTSAGASRSQGTGCKKYSFDCTGHRQFFGIKERASSSAPTTGKACT
jgi:hypothetical protein